MLPQINRLKKKKDFENVFKDGKGFKEDLLYLKIKKNNLDYSRIGFIVGKNFSKKAVERNKIKRRLREIIKERIPDLKKGLDIIIVVMPKSRNNFQELRETINRLFIKAKLDD